jgi:hypothetical protein
LNYPLSRWILSGLAPACLRVLDETLPIPYDSTNIHFVVQDAIAALGIAVDRLKPQSPPHGAKIPSLFNSAAIRFADFPTT